MSRVCFGPSDDKLFSGGIDGKVFRWPAVAQPVGAERGFDCIETRAQPVTLFPDGAHYAAIRQGYVYLGEVKPDTVPTALPDLGTNNNCLLFSPERNLLFSGTWNGVVQVWSLNEQRLQTTLQGVADPVCWLGQDITGRILVAVQWHLGVPLQTPARPHTVSVWNTANGYPRKELTIAGTSASYAVSLDGAWLAAGTPVVGSVDVWSLTNPPRTNALAFPGYIIGVAFSPDAKLLAAATVQGTVRVWKVPEFCEVREFRAASGALFDLIFSSDSRRLVTAGARQGGLQVWDVASWQQLIAVQSTRVIHHVSFSADGNQLTGANSQGDVLTWHVPSFAEIDEQAGTRRLP